MARGRVYMGDPSRSARAHVVRRYGLDGAAGESKSPTGPDYEIVLVDDPHYELSSILQRLEAVDPSMDRINRLAESQVGVGLDLDGKPTWYGRLCCFTVAEFLTEQGPRKGLPMERSCPQCNRRWEIRLVANRYRGANAR